MIEGFESRFAKALIDPGLPVPDGLVSTPSQRLEERFGIYRNNVYVGLVGALEARFPATRRIVGAEFFAAMARLYAGRNPPCSALMMFYGEELPDFIAGFEPAAQVPYLADVARLEAARTRAYHAADAEPIRPDALAGVAPGALPGLRMILHPSIEIVASAYPVVTIWAMNAGEAEIAPVTDWQGEDALVVRPHFDVEVRCLPPGGRVLLQELAAGMPLARAAEAAYAADQNFDLAQNLTVMLGSGAVIAIDL